jgi:protein-disulfide isomerase
MGRLGRVAWACRRTHTAAMKRLIACLAVVVVVAVPAVAASPAELEERIAALEAQVKELTAQVKTLQARPSLPSAPPAQEKAHDIPVGKSPVLGTKGARYVVTVFTDFQCPFCARVDPFLHDVVVDPELKGKVQVVYKHFPLSFHKDARPAAEVAQAVFAKGGDDAFYRYASILFENQRALGPENLLAFAEQVGVRGVEGEAKKPQVAAAIDADMKLGTAIGVRGTPSLFVNGWELRQRSVDGVKALIKEKGL